MSRRTGCILFLLLAAVFLLLNREAYRGYFQDDEINAMSWTRFGPATEYLKGALQPIYKNTFRAVGFYFFRVTEKLFGLNFPRYVAVIQAIHLLNVWMLWLLIRRLGAPVLPACFAVAFFALHTALFDAVWKPAFIFDLLCATLCLASTLLWIRGRWILSFVLFWLAFQTKELAVMLPLVLLCYELWFGERRWKTLVPFVVASGSFAVQALIVNPVASGDYSFHFTPAALAQTASFYAGKVFFVPLLGFFLPIAGIKASNRRTWFGLATLLLYFVPLLFLPGRIQSAYCYLPFTGLAIALAGMAEMSKPVVVAAVFLLWFPLNLYWLNAQKNETLRQDRDIRQWITSVGQFAKTGPAGSEFAYDGMPDGFRPFGLGATLKYFLFRNITMVSAASPAGARLCQTRHLAILKWDEANHQLHIQTP
jgi:hypothetical protein